MVLFRWILGLPVAALITVGLFAIMAGLIQKPIGPLPTPIEKTEIDIFMDARPPVGPKSVKPDPLPKEQPPVDIPKTLPSDKPTQNNTTPTPDAKSRKQDFTPLQIDGPIIRVAPTYPEGCRSKGIEGEVLVQFDVTAEGNVVNVRVIQAPDRCFNRIVSTVSKWKYPPAYQNGRPVKRYGVVERFNFQLTG